LLLVQCSSISRRQAGEQATLTLACRGTSTWVDKDYTTPVTSAISMGIIVNLADRTVQGFGDPGEFEVIKILSLNDVTVGFLGGHNPGHQIYGSIDRVTGEVEATAEWNEGESGHIRTKSRTEYSLKCRPTQRMF
jgi:hypothetical protein